MRRIKLVFFALCNIFKNNCFVLFNFFSDSFKCKLVALLDFIVIIFVFKGKGKYSCVNKVCNMNSCKALCYNRLNTEIKRNKRRMLTA